MAVQTGQWETARVLVTVKAAPQPSSRYGDTVCVAGIRVDRSPYEWIRLYPVPFRYLDGEHQFVKYELIEVPIQAAAGDGRPESHKIDASKINRGTKIIGWPGRVALIRDLVSDDMCELLTRSKSGNSGPSLAAIRPRHVSDLLIESHPGWTDEQRRKMEHYAAQDALFGEQSRSVLDAPRFDVRYKYLCGNANCSGHKQGVLDWELVALQRRLRDRSDRDAAEAIRQRFFTQMCAAGRHTVFYVGNQAKRRHVFSVLGVFYPPVADMGQLALWDQT